MGALEKCPANGCRPERDRDLPLRARRRKRAESRFPNKASHPACRGVADARLAATYNQFLASDGKWMFMKPSIMKRMAESLQISLNYKAEPNWLTYSKLQELADRVYLELQDRGLKPHSRIDVQASSGRQSPLKTRR
jgi:hypothetical protein